MERSPDERSAATVATTDLWQWNGIALEAEQGDRLAFRDFDEFIHGAAGAVR